MSINYPSTVEIKLGMRCANLAQKLNKIRELAKDLKHGEDCFKSHSYKDEGRCRCSLLELLKLLEKE